METINFIGMLLQTLVALAAVCGLAYVIFRVVLPKLQIVQTSGNIIRVVERVGLDQKRSLFVVEVAGKWLLVGASENGVHLVSELNEADAAAAERRVEANRAAQLQRINDIRSSFAEKLTGVMKRKEIKNDANQKSDQKSKGKSKFLWTSKK